MADLFLTEKEHRRILSIVATQSNMGKTTLIEKLVKVFKSRGYRVGVLKHDAHKFEIDKEGKDSYRFTKAGADKMVISSKEKLAMVEVYKEEKPIEEIIELFNGVDLILIEGFKKNPYLKIEVHRKEIDSRLLCLEEEFDPRTFIAVAADEPLDLSIPVLNLNEVEEIADFIEKQWQLFSL